jgi:hypothetical protein
LAELPGAAPAAQESWHVSGWRGASDRLSASHWLLSAQWAIGSLRKRSDPLVLLDENGKKPKNVRVETFAIDEFKEGTRFRDAVNLYVFDKQLRTPALDALERIEVAIRVEISHTLCLTQARTAVRGFCSQLVSGYMPYAAAPVVWQASAVGRARARNSSNTTRLSTDCRWRSGLLAKLETLVRCPRFTAACACRGRTGSPTTLA